MAAQPHKYAKKVIVTDDLSTPEARAARLRRLRNMANLSRQAMCQADDLNTNTYKGWEIARYGGLPVDGAERVVKRVSQENVICSTDWLLYGKGPEPYILPSPAQAANLPDEKQCILQEVMLFQSLHAEAVYCEICDDAMIAQYAIGDYVAGIRHYGSDIISLASQPCIVQTNYGETMVRCLRKDQEDNRFMLYCIHPNTTVPYPTLYNIELAFAAPIIRHYKI